MDQIIDQDASGVSNLTPSPQPSPRQSRNSVRPIGKLRLSIKKASIFLTPKQLKNPLLLLLFNPHNTLEAGRVFFNINCQQKKIYKFIQDFAFFKQFFGGNHLLANDENTIYYICSKMQLEVFDKGYVIFQEFQESNNKMYVVISGKVAIVISKPFNSFGHQNKQLDFQDVDLRRYGTKVNEIGPGEGFGEKALFAETRKLAIRSATCICLNEVIAISLDRESFLEVIQQFKMESKEKLEFLRQVLPFFDRISSQQTIDNLMYSFKDEVRALGSFLTIEGEVGENLYLLISGELSVYKMLNGKSYLIGIINEKQIIGEELMLVDPTDTSIFPVYQFSYQVSSQEARLYRITIGALRLRAPFDCISQLIILYHKKYKRRIEQLQELEKQKKIHVNIVNEGVEKEELDFGGLNNFSRKKFVKHIKNKLTEEQISGTKYLIHAQKKTQIEQLRKKVILAIMGQIGQNLYSQEQTQDERIVQIVKETEFFQKRPNIQKLILMEENWIDECDIEELKQELINIGQIGNQKLSLRSKLKFEQVQDQLQELIDLQRVNSQYLQIKKIFNEVGRQEGGIDSRFQ